MNIRSLCMFALGAGMAGACSAGSAATPGFSRIMSELDAGGDYLEVLNAPTFQSDIDSVLDFVQAALKDLKCLKNRDLLMVQHAREAVTSVGLLSFRGCGSSVRQLNDSTYRHQGFLLTEGKVPLFDIMACQSRPWTVESYLPRSTALAASCSTDAKSCMMHAAEALKKIHPSMSMMIRTLCSSPSGQDSLLDGFVPGTLFAVSLDGKKPWTVPEQNLVMPTPGLLVVQAVKGNAVWTLLKTTVAGLSGSGNVVCSTSQSPNFPGMDRFVMSFPASDDWNFSPACAYDAKNGMIVAASSVELLDAALAAGVKKQGRLLDDAAFRASAKLPERISGFAYLAPQTVQIAADVVRQALTRNGVQVSPTLMAWLEKPMSVWYAGAFERRPDGIKCEAYTNIGACNTLRLLMRMGLPQIGIAGASAASTMSKARCNGKY